MHAASTRRLLAKATHPNVDGVIDHLEESAKIPFSHLEFGKKVFSIKLTMNQKC